MLKKFWLHALLTLVILCGVAITYKVMGSRWPMIGKEGTVVISESLPFGIERDNPVPEVRHWDLNDKTYYYFNWGLKKTGGYSLELISATDHLIKIRAKEPAKDQLLIQSMTFPSLLVSLPRDQYQYTVVNDKGDTVSDIFKPKRPPLKITLFLPRDGQVLKRRILRDPYSYSCSAPAYKVKTPALIALESLFNQDEMLDFVNLGVLPGKAVFRDPEKKWYILLSPAFENLSADQKELLQELITKTVLTLTANHLATVKIITDPALIQ
ncbi:MAG TPA: hypothetical protein DDW65_24390 [Firmicutes bacterium]|jgi:hypothetical protein|nr:hypothetical protein [Bacillota bacterium]